LGEVFRCAGSQRIQGEIVVVLLVLVYIFGFFVAKSKYS
jgi:hypothetical protein